MDFIKDEENSAITFEYNGKRYSMTKDEIYAAYRYQEKLFRLEDAENQIFDYVFGYDVDPDNLTVDEKEELEYFESENHVTLSELLRCASNVVFHFEDNFDCNVDENTQWTWAVRKTIDEIRSYA